jgi:hypothetical protein
VHLDGPLRRVDEAVVVLEDALVFAGFLSIAAVAAGEPLEDGRQKICRKRREPPEERLHRVVLGERDPLLGEQVAGIELRVHQVIAHADLRFPIAYRPCDGKRAAIAREERGMTVDDAVLRHVDRLAGDQPRKAGAERQVGLVRAEQRRERMLRRRKDHVHLLGVVGDVLRRERRRWRSRHATTGRDHGDRLVAEGADDLRVLPGDYRKHRDQNDAPGRLCHQASRLGPAA